MYSRISNCYSVSRRQMAPMINIYTECSTGRPIRNTSDRCIGFIIIVEDGVRHHHQPDHFLSGKLPSSLLKGWHYTHFLPLFDALNYQQATHICTLRSSLHSTSRLLSSQLTQFTGLFLHATIRCTGNCCEMWKNSTYPLSLPMARN